jgi:hypothetical protein
MVDSLHVSYKYISSFKLSFPFSSSPKFQRALWPQHNTDTGYTILIHGLIHRLDYIRITIPCYANIVMTGLAKNPGEK